MNLHSLQDTSRKRKQSRRVGRGIGSTAGKTCGRGTKGAGARSGWTSRAGYEGGQFRLYMKLPIRGFSNVRFAKIVRGINLDQIEEMFEEGDVVNLATLRERGFIGGRCDSVKILGNGELKKKVTIEVNALSESAKEKLHRAGIEVTLIG